ncbi:MAG TPA: glycosyltransferase family 9 protein [Acidobacteriota bacterium]|nr:glycosyltransferase family 9 protein [Acidobacteriota bacterium]
MSASPGILIIRLSSLGDILHTLPALADLRSAFPNSRIDWLVARRNAFLVSAVTGIDTVFVLEKNISGLPGLIRKLRKQRYDFSIDFQGLLKTAALGFTSGARTRLGFSRDLAREFPAHWFYSRTMQKPGEQFHVLQLNRMLAGLTGAGPVPFSPGFRVSDQDVRLVESMLQKEKLTDFVVINPGGGWSTKRWSLQRYGDLAKRIITELGLPVVVTTGPEEEPCFRSIAESCGGSLPRHFPVSFLQLIPLYRKARLVIGGDTGPFHLACVLGTPVVGIFGPTSPVRNGSWRSEDEIVAHTLSCSSCYGRSCSTNNECMDIPVDEVFAAVARRMAKTGSLSDAYF